MEPLFYLRQQNGFPRPERSLCWFPPESALRPELWLAHLSHVCHLVVVCPWEMFLVSYVEKVVFRMWGTIKYAGYVQKIFDNHKCQVSTLTLLLLHPFHIKILNSCNTDMYPTNNTAVLLKQIQITFSQKRRSIISRYYIQVHV